MAKQDGQDTGSGERLRAARLAAGFETQAALADHMGISKTTYNAHENGQNGIPSHWAVRYARLLGCDLAWLLTGDGDMATGTEGENTLRLPPGISPQVRSALQTILDHLRDSPAPAITEEDRVILSETVDLFRRVHGESRKGDADRATAALERLSLVPASDQDSYPSNRSRSPSV